MSSSFKNCTTCRFARPLREKVYNQEKGVYEAAGKVQYICRDGVDNKGVPFKYIRYVHTQTVCGKHTFAKKPETSLCDHCKLDYQECFANVEIAMNRREKTWVVIRCNLFELKTKQYEAQNN